MRSTGRNMQSRHRVGVVAFAVALSCCVLAPAYAQAPRDPAATEPPAAGAPVDKAASPPSDTDDKAAVGDVPSEPVRVVVPDFTAITEGVVEAEIETITATVVYQLSKVPKLSIVSAADIRHMLDLEASKQVMGCSESTSCLTEIADALGAPLLVAGQVSRLGGRLSVSLALIDAANASVVKRAQAEGRDLISLTRALKPAVNMLVEAYGGLPDATVDESRTTFMRALADRANDPDTVMLFAMMALGVVSPFFLPLVWILPILQAIALWTLGDDLAGREYPAWLLAIPAGYAMLALGTIVGAAFSIAAINTQALGEVSTVLAFAGAGTIFATLFVVEPLAVWIAGTLWARDIELSKRAAEDAATPNDRESGSSSDDADAPPPSEAEPAAGDALGTFLSRHLPPIFRPAVVGGVAIGASARTSAR